MRTEVAFVLTGMQDALRHAALTAICVPLVFLAVVAVVLLLDRWGWLP